jgi:hypothetical protein
MTSRFCPSTVVQQPLVGLCLRIIEASRSQSDKPHSVGLLWTSDQPDAEASTNNTQQSQETDIHAQAGFEPAIPESERPQTHALDRADTGIGWLLTYLRKIHLH